MNNQDYKMNYYSVGLLVKIMFITSIVIYEAVRMTNKVSMNCNSTVDKQLIDFPVQALILDKKLNLRLHFNTTLESDVIVH